jgi:hypothetical protein
LINLIKLLSQLTYGAIMRTLSTFLLFLLFTSSLLFAQNVKDLSQKPVSFNNPLSVSGPTLDAPLATFYESFEGVTFPPAGWVKYSPDGGTGWTRITAGTTPLPGWTGGTATPAPVAGSGTGMAYATWNTGGTASNDQWLVTPQIMNVQSGDSLKFWIRKFSNYADQIQVKISTSGNAIANFTTTVQNIVYATTDSGWVSYAYKLGDFVPNGSNIYIAFREIVADNFNDGDALCLDEVKIVQGVTPPVFFDNFDSYTVGNLVACSNPTFWTTWSLAPCGAEDALVSNDFAYSGTNSAKIVTDDDLVKRFGTTAYTSGKYKISLRVYIPATKAGYLNTLATFSAPTYNWAMEMYFDANGSIRVNPSGAVPVTLANAWTAGQWHLVEHVVDLDANFGQVYFNGVMIQSQQYTLGAYTTAVPLTLAANDFFGATANDVMYIDDYSVEDLTVVPVELTSFAVSTDNRNVNLSWSTATELNNSGFQIERSTGNEYEVVGFVAGHGTTTEVQNYSFRDQNVNAGSYSYRLKQIDFDGTFEYSNTIEVEVIGIVEFALDQNYPNPFNPTTTINFSLAEPTFVKLAIYNLLGEEVEVLKNEYMNAGSFNITFDASSLPSGMYLYKVETAQFSSVRKMMLMK